MGPVLPAKRVTAAESSFLHRGRTLRYPQRVTSRTQELIPSWRPGRFLLAAGRTKLVVLGGLGGRTGDAERSFFGLAQFLAREGGYDRKRDILEATYAGHEVAGRWQPRPFGPQDTKQHLIDSAEAVAGVLEWYRDALPASTRFCVLGYSLGGVVAMDGVAMTLARDRQGWQGRLGGVVTLVSPLRGCNAGPFMQWAWVATNDRDPLGLAGPDLDKRWTDPQEQARVERRAAFIRSQGVPLLTLADPDDAVVRPEEALVLAPGESPDDVLVNSRWTRPGSHGHGGILDDPVTWTRVLSVVGPQQTGGVAAERSVDPIELEIEEIKARLRAAGRLPAT